MSARQRFRVPVNYYRHFDADLRLDMFAPASGAVLVGVDKVVKN